MWQAISYNARINSPFTHSDRFRESMPEVESDKLDRGNFFLFNSNTGPVNLSTAHPSPVQIFRLWQVYLDNVNPLLKVTHTPTLQPRIIEATGNLTDVNPTLEALMFSIYSMAIVSLDPDTCQSMFGIPHDHLLMTYQHGCQQALLNCGFLRNDKVECLTALFLYLVCLKSVLYKNLPHLTRFTAFCSRIHRSRISILSPGNSNANCTAARDS